MTFKGEHDLKFRLQFALLAMGAAVTLGAFIWGENILAAIVSLPLLLATAVGGTQLYKTQYTLREELLEARSGLYRVLVDYKDITLLTEDRTVPANGYVPLATSSRKIYVFYTQDKKSYRLELSPQDREGFARELGKRLQQEDTGDL